VVEGEVEVKPASSHVSVRNVL